MRILAVSFLLLSVSPASEAPARCDTPKVSPIGHQAAAAPFVEASYGYSAEMVYRHIEVKGGKLSYTYNAKNSKVKPGQLIVRQEPNYTEADKVTKVAPLTPAELSALEKQIRTSGFLKLKPVYDDRPRQRAYPTGVMGAVKGKRVAVTVRHGTDPPAFRDLATVLIKLVHKHFPAAPAP